MVADKRQYEMIVQQVETGSTDLSNLTIIKFLPDFHQLGV